MGERVCAWCGTDISRMSPAAAFCRAACGKRFRRIKSAHKLTKKCPVCSDHFDASGRHHRKVVCSSECKRVHRNTLNRLWANQNEVKDRRYATAAEWRDANKERVRKYLADWRAANYVRLRETKREWDRRAQAARALSTLLMPIHQHPAE